MDPRRIELQIRVILVTYRGESRRLSSSTMIMFRQRAMQLLDGLEDAVALHPELGAMYAAARDELSRDGSTPEPHGPGGDQSLR